MKILALALCSLALLLGITASAPALAMDPEVRELLDTWAHEPDVREVQRRALEWANVHQDRVPGWYRQVRLSAALPRFRVQGDIRTRDTQQLDLTQNFNIGEIVEPTGSRTLDRDNSYTQYDVRGFAQWELSELVWDNAIIRIATENQRIVRMRQDILNTVTSLYFERRQRQIDLELNAPTDLQARLRATLAIQQLTANLDALTGGWFAEAVGAGH